MRRLFYYIHGKNDKSQTIEMTAPVITQVSPSDGPSSESNFTLSYYVPRKYQADPPPAKNVHVQRWDTRYVAVKQFDGYVSDDNAAKEAAELEESLKGTDWGKAIAKSRETGGVGFSSAYTVAQYNAPYELFFRVNEIWMSFQIDK